MVACIWGSLRERAARLDDGEQPRDIFLPGLEARLQRGPLRRAELALDGPLHRHGAVGLIHARVHEAGGDGAHDPGLDLRERALQMVRGFKGGAGERGA